MDRTFTPNEGSADRAGRGLFALVFLALGLARRMDGKGGGLLLALAALLGVTSVTGTCPAYKVAGVDTTKTCTFANAKEKLGL